MITLLIILGYIMSAGFIGNYFVDRSRLSCSRSNGKTYCHYYLCSHGAWWLAGAFWPVAFPFLLAAQGSIGIAYNHANGIDRAERKRLKEMQQANHKIELAKKEAERIKILEKEAGIIK